MVAVGLAIFSFVLGAAELIWPQAFTQFLGIDGWETLIRIYGLREIIAGIGILAMPRQREGWLWFRVAGDVLDVGTVLYALTMPGARTTNIIIALVLLLPIGLLDLWCARALGALRLTARGTTQYADRSGLPNAGR
jgi:hypothetical protein